MRTRFGPSAREDCTAAEHATAFRADGNTQKNESPLRVDLNASELDERDTNDFPVPPQGLAVRFGTELAEELCRPFDVRKEECDGPARKVVGHVAERTTCAPAARRAGMPR